MDLEGFWNFIFFLEDELTWREMETNELINCIEINSYVKSEKNLIDHSLSHCNELNLFFLITLFHQGDLNARMCKISTSVRYGLLGITNAQ